MIESRPHQGQSHTIYKGYKHRGAKAYVFARCTCGWVGDGQEALDQHRAEHLGLKEND